MNQANHSVFRHFWSIGGRAAQWARSCITALSEDLASRPDAVGKPRTVIVMDAQGMEAFRPGGSSLGRDPAKFAAAMPSNGALLRIGASKAVVKRISLPSGARDVIDAVIRNKVESLAPWPLHETLWGHRLADGAAAGEIAVDVGIVSRKSVDGLLATLAATRIRIKAIEIAGGIPVNLQGPARAKVMRSRIKLALVAASIASLSAAGYGGMLAAGMQSDLASVSARQAEIRRALLGERGASGDPKLESANALLERKKAEQPLVAILARLTELVPDTAWLESIDFDHGKLVINGRGADTPAIVEALEASAYFEKAGYAAATQRDAETGSDTFAISAIAVGSGGKP